MSVEAASIVRQVEEHGIRLSVVGDRIRYSPKSQTPAELLDALRAHKDEVLAYLSGLSVDPSPDDTASLLSWASELAEKNAELKEPIRYVEAPLTEVTTVYLSEHARHHLQLIASARIQGSGPGWGIFTPVWWKEREDQALAALKALRAAVAGLVEDGGR